MAARSQRIPPNVVGSAFSILEEAPPSTCFHLSDLKHDDSILQPNITERLCSPSLHPPSLFWGGTRRRDPVPTIPQISPEHAPNLRELVLDEVKAVPLYTGFPCLTRLALIDGVPSRSRRDSLMFHPRLARFLSECPQLESIALARFARFSDGNPRDELSPLPLPHL